MTACAVTEGLRDISVEMISWYGIIYGVTALNDPSDVLSGKRMDRDRKAS